MIDVATSQPSSPAAGRAQVLLAARAASPSRSGAGSRSRDSARRRSLQRLQVGEQRLQVVGREPGRRHAVAGLDALRIGDPAGEVAARVRQRAGGDRARGWRSGSGRAPCAPPAGVPRIVWHIAHGPLLEDSLPALSARCVPAPAPAARWRRASASKCAGGSATTTKRHVRVLDGRRTRRTGRDRRPAVSAWSTASLSRPGIRSVLPCRFGTQKLWMTSADCSSNRDRPADGHVDLVGGGDAAAKDRVLVLDVPPPLMAGDLDVARPVSPSEPIARPVSTLANRSPNQRDGRDAPPTIRRCGSASTAGVAADRAARRPRRSPREREHHEHEDDGADPEHQPPQAARCVPPATPAGWSADWIDDAPSPVPRLLRRSRLLPRFGLRRRSCRRRGRAPHPAASARSATARRRRAARPDVGIVPAERGHAVGPSLDDGRVDWSGADAVDPLLVHQRRADPAAAHGRGSRCSCTRREPLALADAVGVVLVGLVTCDRRAAARPAEAVRCTASGRVAAAGSSLVVARLALAPGTSRRPTTRPARTYPARHHSSPPAAAARRHGDAVLVQQPVDVAARRRTMKSIELCGAHCRPVAPPWRCRRRTEERRSRPAADTGVTIEGEWPGAPRSSPASGPHTTATSTSPRATASTIRAGGFGCE